LTTPPPHGYTASQMKAGRTLLGTAPGGAFGGLPGRALLLAASCWEVVRFFLVLMLLPFVLETASAAGWWLFPWLLFAASGNLLVAAGGILLAVFPSRYAPLLGLLRLGKAISVFAFLLLLVSGALGAVLGREVLIAGPLVLTLGPVILAVFALDVLFLAALLLLRIERGAQEPPVSVTGLAGTEVGHFH
jgi:hypothetical protein